MIRLRGPCKRAPAGAFVCGSSRGGRAPACRWRRSSLFIDRRAASCAAADERRPGANLECRRDTAQRRPASPTQDGLAQIKVAGRPAVAVTDHSGANLAPSAGRRPPSAGRRVGRPRGGRRSFKCAPPARSGCFNWKRPAGGESWPPAGRSIDLGDECAPRPTRSGARHSSSGPIGPARRARPAGPLGRSPRPNWRASARPPPAGPARAAKNWPARKLFEFFTRAGRPSWPASGAAGPTRPDSARLGPTQRRSSANKPRRPAPAGRIQLAPAG